MNAMGSSSRRRRKQLQESAQQRQQERERLLEGEKQKKKPRKKKADNRNQQPRRWGPTSGPLIAGPPQGAPVVAGVDPLRSYEQYKISTWQGYSTAVSRDGSVTVSPLPYQEDWSQHTSKEVTNMSIDGLKKAIARLEEPLYDVREHHEASGAIPMLVDFMKKHAPDTGTTIAVKEELGNGPVERHRQETSVYSGGITLTTTNGRPQCIMGLSRVMHTGINKKFIADMYPRAFGHAASVPVFSCDLLQNGVEWVPMSNLAIKGMIASECFFDWPVTSGRDIYGNTATGYARFRAKINWDNKRCKIIALCRPTFEDPKPPSAPIRVVDTITLNIGEFPLDFWVTSDLLVRGYLAALDGVIDLGIGFEYDCSKCNVSYSALDTASSDRALLSTMGVCRVCLEMEPPNFPGSVPQPW
ncbi:hypothetical protein BH763_gp059 [Gordonia phage Monty]|uniref:Uncharacterized protein n=2 Tax=Montyvirus TaxID=2733196 RepID=A0A160DGA0_9CAUD|nr:hypothetical protein BH763_gp059 [Gordonia phage Monty]YP_009856360.1 hypothetical protein HWD07_gp060 [Gordonia phage John316]ANA85934.1 hypothetical protein PBI_MONTY_70 [Gordonia phage Monty]QIG61950.1 hypothetical protein SEA_JOHN316_74 [Gordonia phage John316]